MGFLALVWGVSNFGNFCEQRPLDHRKFVAFNMPLYLKNSCYYKMDEEAARPFDVEDKALIKMLMREYPTLDQMQCETLVWAHKTNNLGVLEEK